MPRTPGIQYLRAFSTYNICNITESYLLYYFLRFFRPQVVEDVNNYWHIEGAMVGLARPRRCSQNVQMVESTRDGIDA